jgi:hypothetical protein
MMIGPEGFAHSTAPLPEKPRHLFRFDHRQQRVLNPGRTKELTMTARGASFRAVLTQFAASAAKALGQALAAEIAGGLKQLWEQRVDESDPPSRPPAMAIDSYLRGGAFAAFNKQRVEDWALWKLSEMPAEQGATLLQTATAAAQNSGRADVGDILKQLVRHFAGA